MKLFRLRILHYALPCHRCDIYKYIYIYIYIYIFFLSYGKQINMVIYFCGLIQSMGFISNNGVFLTLNNSRSHEY